MPNKTLLFALALGLATLSCSRDCICSEGYDETVIYHRGDVVAHAGTCWKANGQGRGIEPGPWLENGNDIWREKAGCD